MELKALNKPDRSESMLTMSTLRRNSKDSQSIDDNLPLYRPDMERQSRSRFLFIGSKFTFISVLDQLISLSVEITDSFSIMVVVTMEKPNLQTVLN